MEQPNPFSSYFASPPRRLPSASPTPAPQPGASPCPGGALPHTAPRDKGPAGPGYHDGQKTAPPRAAACCAGGLHMILWSQIFALTGAQSLALGCLPAPRSSCGRDVFPGVGQEDRCLMVPAGDLAASGPGDFSDSHRGLGGCHQRVSGSWAACFISVPSPFSTSFVVWGGYQSQGMSSGHPKAGTALGRDP